MKIRRENSIICFICSQIVIFFFTRKWYKWYQYYHVWKCQSFHWWLSSRLLHWRPETSRRCCLSLLGGFLWIRFHSICMQWLFPSIGVLHMFRYVTFIEKIFIKRVHYNIGTIGTYYILLLKEFIKCYLSILPITEK